MKQIGVPFRRRYLEIWNSRYDVELSGEVSFAREATVTALLDKFEKRGLVYRRRDDAYNWGIDVHLGKWGVASGAHRSRIHRWASIPDFDFLRKARWLPMPVTGSDKF